MFSKLIIGLTVATAAAQKAGDDSAKLDGGLSSGDSKDSITKTAICSCSYGKPAIGDDCTVSGNKCVDCITGYELQLGRCVRKCTIRESDTTPYCCNDKTYPNFDTARCGKGAEFPKCSGGQQGACEDKCNWPNHDQTSCGQAKGCSWNSVTSKCDFGTFSASNTQDTCISNAITAFQSGHDFSTFTTSLKSCPAAITDDEIQRYREKAANKPGTSDAAFKAMMGITGTDSAATDSANLLREEGKKIHALMAMAKKCHSCMSAANPTKSTCETQAISDFKTAIGTNPPSDEDIKLMITTELPMAASAFALEERKKCDLESADVRAACKSRAIAMINTAACLLSADVSGTENIQKAQELADQTLATQCDTSTAEKRKECFDKRLADLKDITGDANIDKTDLKIRLQSVAGEKAGAVMTACTDALIFCSGTCPSDDAGKKAKRRECQEKARDEYKKYFDATTMSLEEIQPILEKEAIKAGSSIFTSCAKTDCTVTSGEVDCTATEKDTCIHKAMTKSAKFFGKQPKDFQKDATCVSSTCAPNDQFQVYLKEAAVLAAANKKAVCEKAKETDSSLDCDKQFKLAYNAATGEAVSTISSKAIAEAAHEKAREDAFKVMTAFQQDKADICTSKSVDDCLADLMTKNLGGSGKTFDRTDVFQYKEEISEKAARDADKQCRQNSLTKAECHALIKKAVKDATGIELAEDAIERKKAEGQRDIMAGFASTFYDGKTSEADIKAADDKLLAKFRETTGNSNLKKEDLFREQERNAEKKLAELLNSDGTTQEADIKAVIKEQTGREPTNKEIFQFKKAAAEKNSANVFIAAGSAGLTKDQREAKFIETLRKNLDISDGTKLDGAVVEQYREGAKRKAIANIVDDQKIDVTSSTTAIKTAKDSKLKSIQDTLKTINGADAEKFEAEAYLEDLANENAMKTMSKQGTSKDHSKLLADYKASTGDTDIEMFELKSKIKRQAAFAPETLDKMKDSNLNLKQKREAYKVEMEKIYGEKPSDAEVTELLNEAAAEKMFEVASSRSKARGNKVATTAADIAKENDARRTAYQETYGKAPSSDAEVEKTLKEAMTSKVGSLFHKCRKSGTTEADCKTKLSAQFKDVDPDLVDHDEIKVLALKEEQNSLAKAMKECSKDKTREQCLAKGKEQIAAGRGESSATTIKPYEVDKIMREGAKANLGSQISECDGDYYCKKAAMDDYKEKTLDPTLTEEDFEAAVSEAAKKDGLEIAKACVPSDTIDCGDVITKAFIKANGGKKVKVSEAVTQIKDALPTDIATSLAACTKSTAVCQEKMKEKIKASKPWDKRTGKEAEVSPAEIKKAVKDGAVSIAKNTYESCRRLIDDNDAAKATKEKDCDTAFDTELKKYFPDAGTDTDILADAQKEARRRSCGTKIDAMVKIVNRTKADYKKKTRKEIREAMATHLKKYAPGVDDKLTKNPAEVEKLINDAAFNHVMEAATSCQELGDACVIAKDIKPSARRRSLMTADEQAKEDKKMRLGEAYMNKNGDALEEKAPSKEVEEKISRLVGPKIIKRVVQNCMDADTAPVNMTKCVKAGRSIATLVRGDKKNDKKDYKDGIKADLREVMFKCLSKDGAKRPECVKKVRDRLEKTRDEKDWPKKESTEKKESKEKKDNEAAAEEAEEIVKDAAWKFASDESDLKRGMGPLDKADEKIVRDERRLKIELSGIDKREVDIYDMLGAEFAIIKKGADMKRAGKADADIEKEVETLMKDDEDSFDYTAEKKKEVKAAIDFMIEGDKKGDLKLKPMKEIYCRVCLENDKATDFKIADVKKLVEDNSKANAEIDAAKVKELEKPSKGEVTERACGTVSYPPKPGKKAEDVKTAFSELEKKARRALRMLIGRNLAEGTTSSGEVSTIVAGDDDSVATNPAANYTMLIVGVVIGCLCIVALAVLVYMAVNKKKKPQKTPEYTPHAEL